MLDVMEAQMEVGNFDKMMLPTPSTGPSMSPNTVPSEVFESSLNSSVNLDDAEANSPEPRITDEQAREQEEGGSLYGDASKVGAQAFSPEVAHTLVAVQDDVAARVVLAGSVGWTADLCRGTVFPLLCHARNTVEVVLVDLLDDDMILDLSAVLSCNPTITSIALVNSRNSPGLSLQSLTTLSSLLVTSNSLRSLSIMNCLHHIAPHAMQILGEAILYTRSLMKLNLECNSIQDADLLPLAQSLAAQRTLLDINLDNNHLGYHAFDMLSEVMGYNDRLQILSLNGNLVRCPTDVYEGFFIHEQCQVNRESALLGLYTCERHAAWPSLWKRKTRRLWYVWKKSGYKVDRDEWVAVLQWLDPRGYIEQKVKQWMRLEAAPQQQAPATIWRHT